MTATDRLSLKLSPADKARVARAAALRGMPLSSFVRAAALREAETAIATELACTLSAQESRKFLKALDAQVSPRPEAETRES